VTDDQTYDYSAVQDAISELYGSGSAVLAEAVSFLDGDRDRLLGELGEAQDRISELHDRLDALGEPLDGPASI
jgi:hypothetical protein